MIEVTDMGGTPLYVNSDMIEKIENVPDTILVLQNGHRYLVREQAHQIIDRIILFRQRCGQVDNLNRS